MHTGRRRVLSHKNSQIIKNHVISFSKQRETTAPSISELCARSGRKGGTARASAGLPVVNCFSRERVLPRVVARKVCDVTSKQKASCELFSVQQFHGFYDFSSI